MTRYKYTLQESWDFCHNRHRFNYENLNQIIIHNIFDVKLTEKYEVVFEITSAHFLNFFVSLASWTNENLSIKM